MIFIFVSEILIATSAIRPRVDVVYCLNALARRLAKTRNWTVLILLFYKIMLFFRFSFSWDISLSHLCLHMDMIIHYGIWTII